MKIYLSYRERVAGFFILFSITLLSLFVVGAAIENMWFTPKVSYYAFVTRGEGLKTGSPVLFSGVEIGKIGDMEIMQNGTIKVELSVLEKHSAQMVKGIRGKIHRTMGIGEKRIQLYFSDDVERNVALPPNAVVPVDEPRDLLDVVATLDLDRYVQTMDRAVNTLDQLIVKLDEDDRIVRMIEAFDTLGPTLEEVNKFFLDIHEPFVDLVSDPNIPRAFKGGAMVFEDPKTRKMIHQLSRMLEDDKVDRLLKESETTMTRLNALLAENGHLNKTLAGSDKLLNDGKLDKLFTSVDKFTKEQKIERLLHNMTVLSTQMAKIGPELPSMAQELNSTMRELSVVLKALQRSWLLDDETREVIEEMRQKRRKK